MTTTTKTDQLIAQLQTEAGDVASKLANAQLEADKKAEAEKRRVLGGDDSDGSKIVGGRRIDPENYQKLEAVGQLIKEAKADGAKLQTIGNAAQGGDLLPELLADYIIDKRREIVRLYNLVDTFPQAKGEVAEVPVENTEAGFATTAENTDINESTIDWGIVELRAYWEAAFISASNRLLDRNNVAVGEWIVRKLGDGLARRLDALLWTGSGASQQTGLATEFKRVGSKFTINTATDHDDAGDVNAGITAGDLATLVFSIPSEYADSLAIFCRRDLIPHLATITQTGQRLFEAPNSISRLSPGAVGRIWGVEVFTTEHLGKTYSMGEAGLPDTKAGAIVCGNFGQAMIRGEFPTNSTRIEANFQYQFQKDNAGFKAIAPSSSNIVFGEAVSVLAYRATP